MKKQRGSSLVELLLVLVVISSTVFLIGNIPNALTLVGKSKHISLAQEIASKQIEAKRNISYENLVNDTATINDSNISLLPNGSGLVVVEDCDLSICTQSENIKKVTVTVTWKDNNKNQSIILNTLIAQGGVNQ